MFKKNKLCGFNSFLVMCLLTTSVMASDSVDKSASQSFTLDQAIDYAIANNPDLQIAIQRIEQADAQLGAALSAFYPQVSAKVGYETSNNPAQVFSMIVAQRDFNANSIANINDPGYRQNFRPEIIGKVSLFRGGQDYQNSKAAALGIEQAEFERSSIHNSLIQAVTATYYAHLAANEAQKNAQNAIVAINSELKQTQLKHAAGTVLKSDVLSLEVKLAEAQESQIRAANGIEMAKVNLVNLLGLPSQSVFNLSSSSIFTSPKFTPSFNELLEQAMGQRPEVKAAAKQVEIAQYKVKSAQGAYLPKADAYVSYGQNSQTPGFSSSKENVTAGVAIEMDIFSGFSTQQQLRTAELKATETLETERKTKLAVEQEVKMAYLKLQESLARVHVTDLSVQSADEALRLVKEERLAEVVTVTRYIEAEVARNTAQSNSIAAHYDALSAEAALKKAIGAWK
ncbi:MAG: TolC family protein [Methylococcales bacterium]|nr:TolC family protein [Methylococcales bacterium]